MPHRRRRELRTNYRKRALSVVSAFPRMVVRASSKHTTVQFVQAKMQGDHVLASAKSTELEKLNWKFGGGNLPAAYLTGMLAGMRALGKGIQKAILDIGLHRVSKGARIFGALKGAVDAGVEIPHDTKILPSDSRIKGEHIAEYAKKLSSDTEQYKRQFSRYVSRKLNPEELPSMFEKIKEKIGGSEKKPQRKSDK
jgi:large subunit ribosomal protein L18